jgi:hypothetical protein
MLNVDNEDAGSHKGHSSQSVVMSWSASHHKTRNLYRSSSPSSDSSELQILLEPMSRSLEDLESTKPFDSSLVNTTSSSDIKRITHARTTTRRELWAFYVYYIVSRWGMNRMC